VGAGDGDCLVIRVNGRNGKAKTRHRFCDEASAAAYIQQGEPIERSQRGSTATEMRRQVLTNIVEPNGVEAMQGAEAPLRIPPRLGVRGKAFDFLWVDRSAGCAHFRSF
jgi:hypothetical protein